MWAQGISALVGVWLMAAPGALGFGGPASTNARIIGPFIASFGVIAMAQCTRSVRRANLPLAAWLILAPLVLTHTTEAALNSIACGLAVGALSLVRGRITHTFGGGWAALWPRRSKGQSTGEPRAARAGRREATT